EGIPYWNKFLQGYYDRSAIASDNFDQAVQISVEGQATLTPEMERKGINLPGSQVSAASLTQKDMEDVKLGAELGADFVALSFVRTPQNIRDLRAMLTKLGSNALIVAKIEKPQALDHLPEIIGETDAVMVARGDLGVEMPVEQVPVIQKRIIRECTRALKPVIVATQMLESMIHAPRPTRAEVSDVANAIEDGCDAVMLSAETASGEFPIEAVEIMAGVAVNSEADILHRQHATDFLGSTAGDPLRKAMVTGAAKIAEALSAKFIVLRPESGETARYFSKLHASCPIMAVNPDDKILRRHALYWGVLPLHTGAAVGATPTMDEELRYLARALLERGFVTFKDHVVVVSRYPWGERHPPNTIRAVKVEEVFGDGK
ncbi:MAG: pyruvate kinase, partial [Planctomycetaceae bacterium]|nr:pyruvate kinase [Planctomycetaceae bacterium]